MLTEAQRTVQQQSLELQALRNAVTGVRDSVNFCLSANWKSVEDQCNDGAGISTKGIWSHRRKRTCQTKTEKQKDSRSGLI